MLIVVVSDVKLVRFCILMATVVLQVSKRKRKVKGNKYGKRVFTESQLDKRRRTSKQFYENEVENNPEFREVEKCRARVSVLCHCKHFGTIVVRPQ